MTAAFSTLRDIASRAKGPKRELCELCGTALRSEHRHLINPSSRRLLCACDPCSLLFAGSGDTKLKVVPKSARYLSGFELSDGQWESLLIPIGLAFFVRNSVENGVAVFYPSPAGATESLLPLEAWTAIVEANQALDEMLPDVEALLVNRLDQPARYYLAPIDKCYELVGLIRRNWRGFSGGTEMWAETRSFFSQLQETAHA